MGAALAAITVGAWFAYSALTGKSLTDVFKGGASLNPSANVSITGASDLPSSPTQVGGGIAGTTVIDGKPVINWIATQVLAARAFGWSGTVTSGVRTRAEQVLACINVCGNPNGCPGTCAKPGTSNHEVNPPMIFPKGAVDVTDGAEFDAALKRAKAAGKAGPYPAIRNALPNDPVHRSFTGH